MWNKLELEITLKNSKKVILGTGNYASTYDIKLKILKKDYRFNNSENNKEIKFISRNNFYIAVDPIIPYGELDYFGIYLPINKFVNTEYLYISFYSDTNRKTYLEKLNKAIKEWNNNWNGFYYDSGNDFKFVDNKWLCFCSIIDSDI
jgi:hypothetical protein